jgi:hypothetical protein
VPVDPLLRELPATVRAVQDDLTGPLLHVLWIGGPPCSGKTSIARSLAAKHDLRVYRSDAQTWKHHDAAVARGFPAAARWEEMTADEHWLGELEAMVELSVAVNEERCRLMVEDVEALPAAPLIVAEGTPLFPSLVGELLADRDHGVWLLPTPAFQRARLEERPRTTFEGASDPIRALENRIQRELRVGELIEEEANGRGLHVLCVDETRDLAAVTAAVEAVFAEAIAAGPRAQTKTDRRGLRRDENLILFHQVSTYFERVPEVGVATTSPVEFGCECGITGCDATVEAPLMDAERVFGSSGFLVATGH